MPDGLYDPLKFIAQRLQATPRALALLQQYQVSWLVIFARHFTGDWGNLSRGERLANERALQHGGFLLSAYRLAPRVRVWVHTPADRSSSTILLLDEF